MTKNEIINSDALDFLKSIPDGSVDCVFTDPPYSQEAHSRGMAGKRKIYGEMAEWTNKDAAFFSEFWLDEYVRVCKFPNILLFMNEKELVNVLSYARDKGFDSTRVIPICKDTPMPFTNNNWLSNEYLVHLCDRRLGYCSDYLSKIPYFIVKGGLKETEHPNEKPVPICRSVLYNCTQKGQLVLDCFAGSGSIECACVLEGLDFIACEKSDKWVKAGNERVSFAKKQGFLF